MQATSRMLGLMLSALKATVYNLLGMLSIRRHDYAASIVHFSRAIHCVPNFAAALVNRSFAYQATGDFHSAALDCNRVIEINPRIAMAFHNRGICAKALEDHDGAIADHSQAVALDPNFAAAHGELGVAYSCKHRHAEAIGSLNKAIALNSRDPDHYRNRGYTRFFQGEFDEAAADLRRSLQLEADPFAILLCYLARVRGGDLATEELARDAKALSAEKWPFPVVALFLGALPPGAVLARTSGPIQEAEAHFYLGQWHLLRDHRAEATEAFRQAARVARTNLIEHAGAIAELRRLQP